MESVQYEIKLKFMPSLSFLNIMSEMERRGAKESDSGYDWAAQTVDFLRGSDVPTEIDDKVLQTRAGKRAVEDVTNVAVAMLSGQYPVVRQYLNNMRYAFVVGFPRSGGSYLTKELLKAIGMDHRKVPESLAHDGFPDIQETWYQGLPQSPYYHLQSSIFQVAEFLVASKLYYQRKSRRTLGNAWLAPKKMHKLVSWASSLKMLLGKGVAQYVITIRHPVPAAISVAEKSGGMPKNGLFPALQSRSAIESWISDDVMHLGYDLQEIAKMPYIEAICLAWTRFYARLATSGIFLAGGDDIVMVPYGKESMETIARDFRTRLKRGGSEPEPFMTHDKSSEYKDWFELGDEAVNAVAAEWGGLGIQFPKLTKE